MYSFVQYCRLPYHLQDDDSKSLKCALINSVIGGLVAFLVGIFAMSLKMDIKLALYIAIPLSILSTIAVYLQHTIMRKRELKKRDARYLEHLDELNVMFPKLPVDKKEGIALAQANRNS